MTMTNHPRSPRAKFRRGQLVRHINGFYVRIIRKSAINRQGDIEYLVMNSASSDAVIVEWQLRPLTKKEAGR